MQNNPPSNALPSGLTIEQVEEGVKHSGYPLQTVVAAELMHDFAVTEEWGFVDRETGIYRSLDIFAYKNLYQKSEAQSRAEPSMVLLIECKRSDLPYVFFKSPIQRHVRDFPAIYGLSSSSIELHQPKRYSYYEASECLGLAEHEFINSGPIICSTFSKSLRKGKDLELSGTDPFNSIMLPLVNSMDHAFKLYKLRYVQDTCYPNLTLAVCVLDAPMIVADALTDELGFYPWVRVIRQEPIVDKQKDYEFKGVRHYAVDVVHKDYLKTFITEHLFPFADFFVERALKKHEILATCKGLVSNIDNWQWDEITPKDDA